MSLTEYKGMSEVYLRPYQTSMMELSCKYIQLLKASVTKKAL